MDKCKRFPRQRRNYTKALNPKFGSQSLCLRIVCKIQIECIIRIGYKSYFRHSVVRGKVKITLGFGDNFIQIIWTLILKLIFRKKAIRKQSASKNKMKRRYNLKSEVKYEYSTSFTATINQSRT
ncbi:PREDICTED: uncharacterized protein LOC108975772 [Bactrocera latifrons]|uniref:uncharacterized protein LOC108975772 n=1 Tax=Bactrocera latifrons TaxID=174628 RepID=UPI0008DE130E|nr:PREDICTED: uncharacterized protein LOC108975772 [Bactrocera latifrons]